MAVVFKIKVLILIVLILRWDYRFFLVILRKSVPFALLVLLMASYNRIDPILLRRLDSDAAAGVYAGAFRLLDALTTVAYLVSVPLLPVFSRLCHDKASVSATVASAAVFRLDSAEEDAPADR